MAYTSTNPRFENLILTDQVAGTPDNPKAGSHKVVNRSGILYVRDSAGTEAAVNGGNATTTKTANYTALTTDDLILCNTNAFTVTLPAASTAKQLKIMKIGSDTNVITIARAGSDTFEGGGTSTTLNTELESVTLQSDGTSKWYILKRKYKDGYTNFTMTIGGSSVAPTKGNSGTPLTDKAYWKRVKGGMEVTYKYAHSSAGASGTGVYLFPLPFSAAVDTNIVTVGPSANDDMSVCMATGVGYGGGVRTYTGVLAYNTTNLCIIDSAGNRFGSTNGNFSLANSSVNFSFTVTVPVSGWN